MEDVKEKAREYAEQALRELVDEGPTQPQVQLVGVDCKESAGGSGHTACILSFNRPPAPVLIRIDFMLQEGDGTPEGARRANVDEIKRAFNKKVYGT